MKKNIIATLLKDKEAIYKSITERSQWHLLIPQFLLVALIGIAGYGVVMSTYDISWAESWEFAWKLVVTMIAPLAICAPSLYVFNAIRGSKLDLMEIVYVLCGSVAISSIVLLAFAPIAAFFTWTMEDIDLIRVMNGGLVALSVVFGLIFIQQAFIFSEKKKSDSRVLQSITTGGMLLVWFIVLVVVTVQMSLEVGEWYNYPEAEEVTLSELQD